MSTFIPPTSDAGARGVVGTTSRSWASSCGARRVSGLTHSTPVGDATCPGQFTFDPDRARDSAVCARCAWARRLWRWWITPDEWMLPGPLSAELFKREQARLYPDSVVIVDVSSAGETVLPAPGMRIVPSRGRFRPPAAPAPGAARRVRFHTGFSSDIGALPYDRRSRGVEPLHQPPVAAVVGGGAGALQAALTVLGTTGTVSISDSLTYSAVADLSGIAHVLVQAHGTQRPVVRLNGGKWTLAGGPGAQLAIEGVLLSGFDLILSGSFETVTLATTTLDPGEQVRTDGTLAIAVDGHELRPTTIWVEGSVGRIVLRRTISGPIRTRNGGSVGLIEASDSIIQGVRTALPGALASADVVDGQRLLRRLRDGQDALGQFLRGSLSAAGAATLAAYNPATQPTAAVLSQIVTELNTILNASLMYTPARFAGVPLPPQLELEAQASPPPAERLRVNRLLLEAAYPFALAPAAIACTGADVALERTTVMGQLFARRLSASESILFGFTVAEDTQEGCVRFSAFVDGSKLNQPYESVSIADRASIFQTMRFGQPDFAQLSLLADREIVSGTTIREGAKNGSEMGAFSREMYAIKERGLQFKFGEFMPIGLTPVLVYVT